MFRLKNTIILTLLVVIAFSCKYFQKEESELSEIVTDTIPQQEQYECSVRFLRELRTEPAV